MVDGANIVVFADYMGLKVSAISDLRSQLRRNGARLRVIKNTLARRVFKEAEGIEIPDDFFKGPLAVVTGEDPVTTAKIIIEFFKGAEIGVVRGGVSDNAFVGAKVVTALSNMPSKEENLARILGAIKSPITKVHSQLRWPMQKLVLTVKAVGEKKAS